MSWDEAQTTARPANRWMGSATRTLSRAVRRLARVRSPFAVRRFAARYGIDTGEAEKPLDQYGSVFELFTRRLKSGARPLDPAPQVLLCPADGTLAVCGPIRGGTLVQAKGRGYALADLLANLDLAARFEGGSYATVYLSPRDYHRVHAPATGEVTGCTYVPGTLFPVNPFAAEHIDGLFARNERLITRLDTEIFGEIVVVMVGATCVGHITVAYDDAVVTNVGRRTIIGRRYAPPRPIERGAELGVFEMGSTVILVVSPNVKLVDRDPSCAVRVGMRLGIG